jgi:hypothetical protein
MYRGKPFCYDFFVRVVQSSGLKPTGCFFVAKFSSLNISFLDTGIDFQSCLHEILVTSSGSFKKTSMAGFVKMAGFFGILLLVEKEEKGMGMLIESSWE